MFRLLDRYWVAIRRRKSPRPTSDHLSSGPFSRRPFGFSRNDLKDLNRLGWLIFAAVMIIAVHQSFQKREARDFVYFYSVGYILNHYSPEQLYDYELQKSVFNQVLPLKKGVYGPSPYPPYVAMFFQPFALLPYATAYRLWMGVTLALYLAGLWLLIGRFCARDPLRKSLFFCFGLLFWPFISWTMLGGQLSAVGFLAMAFAIYFEDSDRHFLSGLALSACMYKPTLLVLILPMLFVIRRFRTLAGFGAGTAALITSAALAEGPKIWLAYIEMTARFARIGTHRELSSYVDIGAFSTMFSPANTLPRILVFCIGGLAGGYLIYIWWRTRRAAANAPAILIWSTTLTWTLVLNIYVPIYDVVLVVISVIVNAAAFSRFAPRLFVAACLLLLICSYVTTWVANETGWQILTLVLASFGILQMSIAVHKREAGEIPGSMA